MKNVSCPTIPSYEILHPRCVGRMNTMIARMAPFQIKYGEMSSEVATTWFIWKKDEDSNVVEYGSLDELEAYIINILPQFLQHCFAKMEQAASYQHHRENASLLLLPVDYTCQAQDEIQSAHWKQSQVSLFTAAF